jgi:hypothetical protein
VITKRSWISLRTSTPTSLNSILDLTRRIVGGDIRNTLFEQGVLSELSQLLENNINPEHKTEAGQLELVKLIHRNLTPNNSVMLAMNKIQPPAKTPKEFFAKFLRVRANNCAIWYSANDLGFFKPNSYGSSSNQTFSRQNNDSSESTSQQKRQKRGGDFRERKPFTIEICWTCGIKGHCRARCNKIAHPDRNQENVPFLQSTMGKRWALKFLPRPVCESTRRLDGPLIAPNPTAGTGKRRSFPYDSNKPYLSSQNFKSYISSLNNSSLSDFLLVTISPFRKDLLLTDTEVVDQIKEVQEVEMEVQEVEEEADSLHAV